MRRVYACGSVRAAVNVAAVLALTFVINNAANLAAIRLTLALV
jgi:hypothetical protein